MLLGAGSTAATHAADLQASTAACVDIVSNDTLIFFAFGEGMDYSHTLEPHLFTPDIPFVPPSLPCWQWVPDEGPPVMRRCRRRDSQQLACPQHETGIQMLYNPALPHHCLFECIAMHLGGKCDEMSGWVEELRQQVSGAWRSLGEGTVLGLTCSQIARMSGTSKGSYIRSLCALRWGGYRELWLLATLYDFPCKVWDASGELLLWKAAGKGECLQLLYDESHYMVVKVPSRVETWGTFKYGSHFALDRVTNFVIGAGGGENASATRSRIAQKLARVKVEGATQLVNLLWDLDVDAMREVKGTPAEVDAAVMRIAKQQQVVLHAGRWKVEPHKSSGDILWERDPWQNWKSAESATKLDENPQIRMDRMEVRSIFADEYGNTIPRRTLPELEMAATTKAIVCVHRHNFKAACESAREKKGPVVLLVKEPISDSPSDATFTRMQLVTRATSQTSWKSAQWSCVTFGDDAVEVTLEGVEISLPESGVVSMIAELRESHVDPSEFQKFSRAPSLEPIIGLQEAVFPINFAKVGGKPPGRFAIKKSGVQMDQVKYVMQHSGQQQITIRCESVDEERQMGIATHMLQASDTEQVRKQLGGVVHLGVIHIKGDRCLIRCDPERLSDVRKAVSPSDPRFAQSPDIMVRSKWCISEVPLHVSALRISQALFRGLCWPQIPLGIGKKFQRRGVHEVIVGSEEPPPVDTLMLEGQVCLIKAHRPSLGPLEAQPRIIPASSSQSSTEPTTESAASAVGKKVQMELKMANDALLGMAERQVATSAENIEDRVTQAVHQRMSQVERRMQQVEQIASKVEDMAGNIGEVTVAIKQLKENQDAMEPMIDTKIAEAVDQSTKALSSQLDGRFDLLGQQLLQQIASMARKRESDDRSDVDMGVKHCKGTGGVRTVKRRKREAADTENQSEFIGPVERPLDYASDTDLDESQLEEAMSEVLLTSWPKGRRVWKMHRPERSTVRELYWEFGRIAKRGVGRFSIMTDAGEYLDLTTMVKDLQANMVHRVIAEEWKWPDTLLLQGIDIEQVPPKKPDSGASSSVQAPVALALTDHLDQCSTDHRLSNDELWQRILAIEERLEGVEQLLRLPAASAPRLSRNQSLGGGGMITSAGGVGGASDSSLQDVIQSEDVVALPDWGSRIAQILARCPRPTVEPADSGSHDSGHNRRDPEDGPESRSGAPSSENPGTAKDLGMRTRDNSVATSSRKDARDDDSSVGARIDSEVIASDAVSTSRTAQMLGGLVRSDGSQKRLGSNSEDSRRQAATLGSGNEGVGNVQDDVETLSPSKQALQNELEQFHLSAGPSFHIFALHLDGHIKVPATTSLLLHGHNPPGRRLPGWSVACVRCGTTVEVRRWKQCRTSSCRMQHQSKSNKRGPPKPVQEGDVSATLTGWQTVENACTFLEAVEAGQSIQPTAKQRRCMIKIQEACKDIIRKAGAPRVIDHEPSHQLRRDQHLGTGGRQFKVATINAGSIRGKIAGVEYLGDLVAIQESMVSRGGSRGVSAEASLFGKSYYAGCPASKIVDKLGRSQVRHGRGLGVLVNKNDSWHGLARQFDKKDECDGRVHSGWFSTHGLDFVVHNLHASPCHPDEWPVGNQNLMQELLDRILASPCQRQLVLGDFQRAPVLIGQLLPLFDAGWTSSCSWPGVQNQVSNHPPTGEERLLDGIMVSPGLHRELVDFRIVQVSSLSTHDALTVCFEIPESEVWSSLLVPPLQDRQLQNLPGISEEVWQHCHEQVGRKKDLYQEFCLTLRMCLEVLGVKAGKRVGEVEIRQSSYEHQSRQRKQVSPPRWRIFVAQKAERHVQELLGIASKQNSSQGSAERRAFLIAKLWRVPWNSLGLESSSDLISAERWDTLRTALQGLMDVFRQQERDDLARWKNRLKESIKNNGKEAARWVRSPVEPTHCCLDSESTGL